MRFLEHRVPPPIVALAFVLVGWWIARVTPVLPLSRGIRITAGIVLAGAGFALIGASVREFRRFQTTIHPLDPERASSIVSTGPFAISRNPMYVGLLLILLGWTAYLAAPAALLAPAGLVAYLTRFQILPEERALSEKFGAPYDAYRRRVRRWL